MKYALGVFLLLVLATGFVLGCGETAAQRDSKMVLKEEPAGAVEVLALRKDAKDQQDVVVVGRIGGRPNPWVKGSAAFPIVDCSLRACSEIPGDTCETPWDFCCEANLSDATVLVMLVDENGKVIKEDPRELLGVKELSTVVVQGKAKRDDEENLTVLATKLHVRKGQKATP